MQSAKQLSNQLLRQLGQVPGWVALLLLTALISVASLLGWHWQSSHMSRDDGQYLLDGRTFSDSELGLMMQALSKAQLDGFDVQGRRLRVPRGRESDYLAALADGDALPPDLSSHADDAMQRNNLFETDRDRQQRMRHAREQDLALAMRSMEGIEDVLVQFDELEQRGFSQSRIMTASVAVLPSEGHLLDRAQIKTLKCMVAATKAGMNPQDVSIIDLRSGLSYADEAADGNDLALADEYFRIKRAIEQEWQQKATQVLSFIPAVRVAVNAELRDDAKLELSMLTAPRRLAFSVAVPESYLASTDTDRPSQPTDTTAVATMSSSQEHGDDPRTRVREAIAGLLPDQLDEVTVVRVTTFPEPARVEGLATGPWVTRFDRLTQHKTAWTVVVAVGGLVGLMTWLTRRTPSSDHVTGTFPLQAYRQAEETGTTDSVSANSESDMDEDELRATLTELVRENPDGAAQILHRWIERAG